MSLGSSELSNFLSALGHKWITRNGWNLWFIVIESLLYLSAFFCIVNWHTSCLNILYVSWKCFPNVLVLSPVIYIKRKKNKTQSLFSLRCEMRYKKKTFIIEWINTCSKLPQSTLERKSKQLNKNILMSHECCANEHMFYMKNRQNNLKKKTEKTKGKRLKEFSQALISCTFVHLYI